MNCTSARKLLYAFADGQLGVKDNCEVLDHLKMCPACSRIVDEHQALRGVIGRGVEDVVVPEGLRSRVAAVCRGSRTASRPFWRRHPASWFVSAACLLLAAGLFLWKGLGNDRATVPVSRGDSAASSIAKVHLVCCEHAERHHNNALPKSLAELGMAICAHYNNRIAALAPDLGGYGYRFESANFCGVRDKPGSEGGHILYRADQGAARISFFSVPRWDCLDKCGNRGIPNSDGFRQYQVDQVSGGSLSILAWHHDATTYICCGAEPVEKMLPMAQQIRSAMARFDSDAAWALAVPRR